MPEEARIELLYFDGCPSHGPAGEALRWALAEEGIEARVEAVAVNTGAEARRLRFNGEDLFPADGAHGPEEWGLRCRVYATPEGLKGSPTVPMLREALRSALTSGKKPPTTN